ncbi:PH domain-containing protein [Polaribacter batillariae]|uniref:PH domain-containing protein n=1 Tax=Polaribacter batillariae TaxID=2808900 RepID=A0ABX7ST13_9FLAO|nr:PH domain-containing protein [Polaribacter batillariae]QTD37385.1 PH domain-containing protein [Polaribacter batillariae]
MDNSEDFSQFKRQSKKGILIIYLNLLYKALKAFWILLFLFIQKFSKISETTFNYIYLGVFVVLVFFLVRAFLIFKNFQFKIENNHFILKRGIIKKINTSIPFDRIQHINFKQNIIQQIINVHEVNIETAGSAKAEISIKALSFKEAKALKNALTIFDKKNVTQETVITEKPLLKVGFLELIKVSLTENHLQSLVLLFAVLIGFYQQISELFEGLGKREVLDDYISENTSTLETSVFLIVSLLIFFTVIAVLSSLVRVVLRHFNLTVFVKNNALEIYQGLTTKNSVILKKDKVQHITVSTNPIKKKLGISFITFKQAISGKVKKKQHKIIKIVGCKLAQVSTIKELLFPNENLEGFDKNYPDAYFRARLYFRSILFFLVLNIVLYFGFESLHVFWMNALLVPIFIFFIELKLRKRYYLFNDELLLLGSGSIETHKTYLPFFKVQNVKLKQTIFQAKKNVADVVFQTASGKIKIPCISMENALKIYNYTLFKIETSQKLWM